MSIQPNEPDSLERNETAGGDPSALNDSLEYAETNADFHVGSDGEDFGGPDGDESWDDADEIIEIESRYDIQHRLGRGGMGDVHFATDRRLKRSVAIKRLRDDVEHSRKAGQRFLIEAQAIAQLNHFNIVQIYDFGRSPDGFFLVMEYVEGDSLAGLLQENGAMGVAETVELISQICDALSLAHERGMVHRDIKPGNILVTPNRIAKLTDFGLARMESSQSAHTQAGTTLGTLDFMAPEQHRDARSADARSDIWSLGATLYQMVTGSSPRIIRSRRIPEELQQVIMTTLEDDPGQRYQTAEDLRSALQDTVTRKSATANTAVTTLGECRNCQRVNGADKKFCEGCGTSLVEPCLKCGSSLSSWTQFCGDCGGNVTELLKAKAVELEADRRELEKLLAAYQFDEATLRLNATLALAHPRLTEYVTWAEQRLSEVKKRKDEQTQWARGQLQAARAIVDEEAGYNRAIQLLEQIPDSLRNREMTELLRTSRESHLELRELAATIRRATSQRRYDGLLPSVERFIELKPNHEKSRRLAENLRRREKSRSGRGRHSGSQRRRASSGRRSVGLFENIRDFCNRQSQDGFYAGNRIPGKKLGNAIGSYGIGHTTDVIALIDCTVFGSAKDGMAICENGLYWHNQFESPMFISWDDFSDATIQTQGVFQVELGHHGAFNTAGSSCGRGWVATMLRKLQAVVQEGDPQDARGRRNDRGNENRVDNKSGDESSVFLTVVDEGPSYDDLVRFCERFSARGYSVGTAIPAPTLNNARESFRIPRADFVAAVLDCTAIGSARNGLAVCETGLYWHNQSESACSALWDEFKSAQLEKKGIFVIEIGTHGNLSSAGSNPGRKWSIDFLRQLQSFIRNR